MIHIIFFFFYIILCTIVFYDQMSLYCKQTDKDWKKICKYANMCD